MKRRNNTSGYCGVTWHAASNKWQARGFKRERQFYLGIFSSKRAAAGAVNGFARANGRKAPNYL
jgi:hypothetical protein